MTVEKVGLVLFKIAFKKSYVSGVKAFVRVKGKGRDLGANALKPSDQRGADGKENFKIKDLPECSEKVGKLNAGAADVAIADDLGYFHIFSHFSYKIYRNTAFEIKNKQKAVGNADGKKYSIRFFRYSFFAEACLEVILPVCV